MVPSIPDPTVDSVTICKESSQQLPKGVGHNAQAPSALLPRYAKPTSPIQCVASRRPAMEETHR